MNRHFLGTLAISVAACVGTETGNPVEGFHSSTCKSSEQVFGVQDGVAKGIDSKGLNGLQTHLMQEHANELAGLRCVAWEHGPDGELTVDAVNFSGGCGAEYQAELVRAGDGAYELRLRSDGAASCGGCTYDWSFSFAPDTADAEDVRLRILAGYSLEPDVEWTTKLEATLGVDDQVSCVESGALLRGLTSINCAQNFGPCTDTAYCDESAEDLCQTGLECVPEAGCRAPCDTDADCGSSGAVECREGVCRAAPAPWNP